MEKYWYGEREALRRKRIRREEYKNALNDTMDSIDM